MSLHQALQDRLSAIEAQLPVSTARPALPRRFMALRHDAGDRVSPVLQQLLAEVLPGALVLDWRQEGAAHAGRMAADGLVYRFRIDAEGVGYRPAWEGVLQRGWELRSDSFLQLRTPAARMDFRRTRAGGGQKRKCATGYGCGNACISLQKECRIAPRSAIGKGRLRRLQQLAAGGDRSAGSTASQVTASRGTAATSLTEKGGNTINQEQSAKVAGEASEALGVFERLKSSAGPISSALNRAADRVEAGEAEATVRKELERDVFEAVQAELEAVGLRKRPRADSLQERIDALKRKCTTGYGCGSSCISLRKECRSQPQSAMGKERMRKLLALAAGGTSGQRGIAPVRAQQAAGLAAGIGQQRGAKAAQLRGARQQAAAKAAAAKPAEPGQEAVKLRSEKKGRSANMALTPSYRRVALTKESIQGRLTRRSKRERDFSSLTETQKVATKKVSHRRQTFLTFMSGLAIKHGAKHKATQEEKDMAWKSAFLSRPIYSTRQKITPEFGAKTLEARGIRYNY